MSMSVLTNKHVLLVGEVNEFIDKLRKEIEGHGMDVHSSSCDAVTPEKTSDLGIDLVILNYLEREKSCQKTLDALREVYAKNPIPTLVLVDDSSDKIQEAITSGAADYFTPHEQIESVMQKMKAVFSETEDFSESSVIDISPVEASVTATGIRVFVVEDDPLLRNLLSIRLEKSSFPYEFSNDGKEVLPVMRQFKPDVIVLDLMLPGRSGFEVLSEVKADKNLKDTPVIVFSNRDGQEDRKRAQELGAAEFYVKAMTDLSELVERIEALTK